ncbi:hypothetical protein D3C78_854460 [compost metagenome]
MGIRQSGCVRRFLRLLCHQRAQRSVRQRNARIVNVFKLLIFLRRDGFGVATFQASVGCKLRQQPVQARNVSRQHCLVVALFVCQNFNTQTALLVREQRQLQIVDWTRRQHVCCRLHAVQLKLIIKDFDVQYWTKQRFVARCTTAVANNLLGIVALVATHLFQLIRQTLRQRWQRFVWINFHRHRQDIQYRTGRSERRRSHTAHKDESGGVIEPSGQTPQPQRDQRQRQIGALNLA